MEMAWARCRSAGPARTWRIQTQRYAERLERSALLSASWPRWCGVSVAGAKAALADDWPMSLDVSLGARLLRLFCVSLRYSCSEIYIASMHGVKNVAPDTMDFGNSAAKIPMTCNSIF